MPLLQVSPAGQGNDNKATFLAEFRALRDRAGIDYEELAARAHYPTDVLKEAEYGPGLPGLPVLAAYVRACGGDEIEWEERWRRLASPGADGAGLPVRPTGASPAAAAGARAGVSVTSADAHDPERIRAALRAHQEREERTLARSDPGFSSNVRYPRVTPASPATMTANGSHHKRPRVDAFDASAAHSSASPASAPPAETPLSESALPESALSETPLSETPQASAGGPSIFTPASRITSAPMTPHPSRFRDAEPEFSAFGAFSRTESAPSPSPSPAAAKPAEPAIESRAAQHTSSVRATAHPAGRNTKRTGHPGLLALIVVLVLVGCVALLALT